MSVLMPYSKQWYNRDTYRRQDWIFAHPTVVSTELHPLYPSQHSCPDQLSSAPDPYYRLTATSYPSLTHTGTFLETNRTQGLGAPGCRAEVSELRASPASSSTTTQVNSADVCVLRHGTMLMPELGPCVRTTMIMLWKEFTIVQELGKQGRGPSTAYQRKVLVQRTTETR